MKESAECFSVFCLRAFAGFSADPKRKLDFLSKGDANLAERGYSTTLTVSSRLLLELDRRPARRAAGAAGHHLSPRIPAALGGPLVRSELFNRFGERNGEALVQTLAGNAPLDTESVAEIVERTEGGASVWRRTEQVCAGKRRAGRPSRCNIAREPAATLAIPSTLHAILAPARVLGRLGRRNSRARQGRGDDDIGARAAG